MTWILVVVALLSLPALAVAGWRMGLRGRGEGTEVETLRKAHLPLGELPFKPRAKVSTARYDRAKRSK